MKEYKRNCKDCGDIIVYNSYGSYWVANKRNSSCFMCGSIKSGKAQRGANHPQWKGGVSYQNGYKLIYQGNDKYKPEHRIVMEKAVGRVLFSKEIVHHINEIRNDNRIENLMLFSCTADHVKWHGGERDIKYIYPKEEKVNGQ